MPFIPTQTTTSKKKKMPCQYNFLRNELRRKTYTQTLAANTEEIKFSSLTVLKGKNVYGISLRRAASSSVSRMGKPLANDSVVNGAFLNIRCVDASKIILEEVSMADVAEARQYNECYYINCSEIDLETSSIVLKNRLAIVPGEDFEFTIVFLEK